MFLRNTKYICFKYIILAYLFEVMKIFIILVKFNNPNYNILLF